MKFIFQFLTACVSMLVFSYCTAQPLHGQRAFTRQDTLRGTITKERAWWDVTYYGITVQPDFTAKTIKGSTVIKFKVLQPGSTMQIDLQPPMDISAVEWNSQRLSYKRDKNVYYFNFPGSLKAGSAQEIRITYAGKPREAIHPPWDGGWVWATDRLGRPWMTVACEGLGASVWFPCKDHLSDEPDSASLAIIVPDSLTAVGNGRLVSTMKNTDGTSTYTWAVKNPINNYDIIPYIGKYVNWSETFDGEKGNLDCSYWALDYNEDSARKQFKQVPGMLKCFEHWFGPYPFYEDSYKLVESPHLGMEHQSAVAYGNKFRNGYLGKDLSGTGWGLKWDYIIIHESGHEWFGNNITAKDLGDMWIHESFTDYAEVLYVGCQYGEDAANEYVIGLRKSIVNDLPVIGPYGVNQEGSGDMYAKGANVIHTIRQVINNDEIFRQILRGLNKTFYHKTVTAKEIEDYISRQSKIDFSTVFEQYLRTTKIPVLEYKLNSGSVSFRWANCVNNFNMSIKVNTGKDQWIKPTNNWKTVPLAAGQAFTIDKNFYIETNKVTD